MKATPCLAIGSLCAALLAFTPSVCAPQVQPEPPGSHRAGYTLSGGVGAGTEGLGFQLGASRHTSAGDIILRMAGTTHMDILGPSSSYMDLAALFGRLTGGEGIWARAAVGPAVAWRNVEGRCLEAGFLFCGNRERDTSATVGLGLQFDAAWTPLTFMGWGITLFGNLNGGGSFAGLTVSVHLGQVRPTLRED